MSRFFLVMRWSVFVVLLTLSAYVAMAWDTGNVGTASALAPAQPGLVTGTTLSINATGQFVLNGVQTFLLGISYFDAQNFHTSDIDLLAARGFNTLRVFAQWDPLKFGVTRSVCDANGLLQTSQRDQMQRLIDYAKTKSMIVLMAVLDVASGTNMDSDAKRLACVTNVVNYFKPTSAQDNWNVLFDVVQEHDSNYAPVAPEWADTTTQLKPYTDAAKAACPTCPIFASSTFINGYIGPSDGTSALNATQKARVSAKVVTNGEAILAIHESRVAGWYNVTGARVAEYKTHLASIGKQNVPVIFDEPCRIDAVGDGFDCTATEAQVNLAAVQAKVAGAGLWLLHTDAGFNLATQTLFQQLDPVEAAITLSLANALAGPGTTPNLPSNR